MFSVLFIQATGALESYGVHTVVANILQTRKERVLLVSTRGSRDGRTAADDGGAAAGAADRPGGGFAVAEIVRPSEEPQIERLIVQRLVALHSGFGCCTQQEAAAQERLSSG